MMTAGEMLVELDEIFNKFLDGYSATDEDAQVMDRIIVTLREMRDKEN